MSRFALSVALAFHLALAGGGFEWTQAEPCAEECPDDDAKGECTPGCDDCTCCPHVRALTLETDVKERGAQSAMKVRSVVRSAPASPEPKEILHVPKARLA